MPSSHHRPRVLLDGVPNQYIQGSVCMRYIACYTVPRMYWVGYSISSDTWYQLTQRIPGEEHYGYCLQDDGGAHHPECSTVGSSTWYAVGSSW